MAAGTGTAADGIIALAGAVNATGSFPGYKPLTDEAIIEAKPDVILMMIAAAAAMPATDDELFAQPAIRLTPAGQDQGGHPHGRPASARLRPAHGEAPCAN